MKKTELKTPSKAVQIFKNFSFLATGKVLGDIFTLTLFVVLSRVFGQEGIGQYSFAMAFTGFFAVFSECGLYSFTIKEISRCTDAFRDNYGRILLLRILLSVGVLSVLLLVLPFLPFSRETKLIIVFIGLYQVLYRLLNGFFAVLVAHEETHLVAMLEVSLRVVIALAGIGTVVGGGDLAMAVAALPITTFAQLIFAWRLVVRRHGRIELFPAWSFLIPTIRKVIPFAASGILYQFYARIDVVCLGFFLGAAAAGIYNVAYRVIFVLTFLSYFAGVALFPLASRLYVNSRQELDKLYHRSLNLTILVALPVAFGLWLTAPELINLLFGKNFHESVIVLRFLSGFFFLACLRSMMQPFLMSCDRQTEMAKSNWIAAVLNVLGNVLLIPSFGIKGAAAATLISETVMVVLLTLRLKAIFGWPRVGSRLVISGTATAVFF